MKIKNKKEKKSFKECNFFEKIWYIITWKPKNKKVRIVLNTISVIFSILLVTSVLFLGSIGYFDTIRGERIQNRSYEKTEYTELTKEQRIEDFEYLWNMAETSLLYLKDMKDLYGYNVLDNKDFYRNEVENCENDIQFYAVINGLLNDIPGCPLSSVTPDYYQYMSAGWLRTNKMAVENENLQGKIDAIADYHKKYTATETKGSLAYRDFNIFSVYYKNGEYAVLKDFNLGSQTIPSGVVKSIDGISAEEYLLKPVNTWGKIFYDKVNDKPLRDYSVFMVPDDEKAYSGDYIDMVIECANGKEKTVKVADFSYTDSYVYMKSLDYDLLSDEEEKANKLYLEDTAEDCFRVYTDDSKNLAYIEYSSCSIQKKDYKRIKKQCEKIKDYENIIIDIRNNLGGLDILWEDYIYPSIFKEDYTFTKTYYMPNNSYTDDIFNGWFDGFCSKLLMSVTLDENVQTNLFNDNLNSAYTKITIKEKLNGTKKNPEHNTVLLTSISSASASDDMAYGIKKSGLGTIIGGNTFGEGNMGICVDLLPNSNYQFKYCPYYELKDDNTQSSLEGTSADILVDNTIEDYQKRNEISKLHSEDKDYVHTIEGRMQWDSVFNCALDELGVC